MVKLILCYNLCCYNWSKFVSLRLPLYHCTISETQTNRFKVMVGRATPEARFKDLLVVAMRSLMLCDKQRELVQGPMFFFVQTPTGQEKNSFFFTKMKSNYWSFRIEHTIPLTKLYTLQHGYIVCCIHKTRQLNEF